MNKTKKRILKIALELFNLDGLAAVSQRSIAEKLGISPGNLTYHFKKKDDISEALYFEFIEQISSRSTGFKSEQVSIESFSRFVADWFALVYEYRFIFLDITLLMRSNAKVYQNYKQFVQVRQGIFLKIIHELEQLRLIRSEEFEGEYYRLYERLHLISDYYLSMISAEKRIISQEDQQKHKTLFFQAIYPYFHEAAKDEILDFLQ